MNNIVEFKTMDGEWYLKIDLNNRDIEYSEHCNEFLDKVISIIKNNDIDRWVEIDGRHTTFLLVLRDVVGLTSDISNGVVRYYIPEDFRLADVYNAYSFKEVMRYLKTLAYTSLDNEFVKILNYDASYSVCSLCETGSYIPFNENFARIVDNNLIINTVGGTDIILPIERCPICGRKL